MLNGEGRGTALILRYANCNLACPFCYAWRSAWPTVKARTARDSYRVDNAVQAAGGALKHLPSELAELGTRVVWVRIQGGEPCLTYPRTMNTLEIAAEALNTLHCRKLNYYETSRCVIQTNGIGLGKLAEDRLRSIKEKLASVLERLTTGRIVFEFSFKSSNDAAYLDPQLRGFKAFVDQVAVPLWESKFTNLAVYPVAGLGPSIDRDNSWIVPIEPSCVADEIPLFHPSLWSGDFESLVDEFLERLVPQYVSYRGFKSNGLTRSGSRLALEELEPKKFQRSWISGYSGRYEELGVTDVPPIEHLLVKTSDEEDRQWMGLFKRPPYWQEVVERIPKARRPGLLLQRVDEMSSRFYPSHPEGHYPYL